jgi:bacterioferritin (cytochrome b1)
MTAPTGQPDRALDSAHIATLNDLLQLDHDAVHSYGLAIAELEASAYRETVRRFRSDHERHIAELTALITRHGGMPVNLPHPTGVLKLATQGAGALGGGDTHVLMAFRANERQARDKYARAAALGEWPADVTSVLRVAAADESRHYDWVDTTLQSLGVSDDSALGKAHRAFEAGNAATADALEAVGTKGMQAVEAARRAVGRASGVGRVVTERPLAAAAIAIGAGVLAAAFLGGRRREA